MQLVSMLLVIGGLIGNGLIFPVFEKSFLDYQKSQVIYFYRTQTQHELRCLHDCTSKYGTSNKASCARSCGLGEVDNTSRPDCGIQYKDCLENCKGNNPCRKKCRSERVKCI